MGKRRLAMLLVAGLAAPTQNGSRSLARADDLAGTWTVRLVTTRHASDTGPRQAALQQSGTLALIPMTGSYTPVWLNLANPTFMGVHNLSVAALGADASGECIPTAGARYIARDSFEIVLNPAPDHGAVVLHGAMRNGVITGTWVVTSYAMSRSGAFEMTRR
jgi:hypothetical protein